MKRTKLTVIIPTLNEETDLPNTLYSCQFADEVLVVDSGSTDHTISLALNSGATVIHHKFTSFADTRNFADKQAKNEWILSIEADVTIPKVLAEEITQAISSESYSAYYLGRINYIWGKSILHTDWSPKDDIHIRLYRRGVGQWTSAVHEQFTTTQSAGKLRHYLIHLNYRTVTEFIDKLNRYSELQSQRYSFISWYHPFFDFFKRYVYKQGFLDGYHGLFLSYLQAVYIVTCGVKRYTKDSK